MQVFFGVLLIIIAILLFLDVQFLRKVSKSDIVRTRNLSDERYAELRLRQRILEIGAALLLFVGTFLGVSTIDNIKKDFKSELNSEIQSLRKDTEKIDSLLNKYSSSVDSLKLTENVAVHNLGDINRRFQLLDKKLIRNQQNLKYTTKVYVIKNLNITREEIGKPLNFEQFVTSNGEKLPKFSSRPMVTVSTIKGGSLEIQEITNDYVRLSTGVLFVGKGVIVGPETYSFDMWIAEPN